MRKKDATLPINIRYRTVRNLCRSKGYGRLKRSVREKSPTGLSPPRPLLRLVELSTDMVRHNDADCRKSDFAAPRRWAHRPTPIFAVSNIILPVLFLI